MLGCEQRDLESGGDFGEFGNFTVTTSGKQYSKFRDHFDLIAPNKVEYVSFLCSILCLKYWIVFLIFK